MIVISLGVVDYLYKLEVKLYRLEWVIFCVIRRN